MKISPISFIKDQTQGQSTPKATYVRPTISSYQAAELLNQLGPARAFSGGRSLDDDLFGNGG